MLTLFGSAYPQHIHNVDFILSLLGRPPAVFSQASNLFTTGDKADHIVTSYLYEDFVCTAEGGWAAAEMMPPYRHAPTEYIHAISRAMDAIFAMGQ